MSSVSNVPHKSFVATKIVAKPFVATPHTKAYYISGHGEEGDDTFTVPDNCVVVVQVHAGLVSYEPIDIITRLCSLSPTILKDPVRYYSNIHDTFGSVAIYLPGVQCPNFQYKLSLCFRSKQPNERYSFCSPVGSGIINMDEFHKDCIKNMVPSVNEDVDEELKLKFKKAGIDIDTIREYILELYRHSIYPTADRVWEEVMTKLLPNGITSIHDILFHLEENYKITQKKICEKPGVYYNFVCRMNDKTQHIFREENNRNVLDNNVESILSTSQILRKGPDVLLKMQHEITKAEDTYKKYDEMYRWMRKYYDRVFKQGDKEMGREMSIEMGDLWSKLRKQKEYIALLRMNYDSVEMGIELVKQGIPSSKNIRTILEKHIGEAEVHRKPYIQQLYAKKLYWTPQSIRNRRQKEYNDLTLKIIRNQAILDSYKENEKTELWGWQTTMLTDKIQHSMKAQSIIKKQLEAKGGYTRKRGGYGRRTRHTRRK